MVHCDVDRLHAETPWPEVSKTLIVEMPLLGHVHHPTTLTLAANRRRANAKSLHPGIA
jgi:hypothetical protein